MFSELKTWISWPGWRCLNWGTIRSGRWRTWTPLLTWPNSTSGKTRSAKSRIWRNWKISKFLAFKPTGRKFWKEAFSVFDRSFRSKRARGFVQSSQGSNFTEFIFFFTENDNWHCFQIKSWIYCCKCN